MKHVDIIITTALCLSTICGDYVVFQSNLAKSSITFRALADSLVHGSVGFFSSIIFFSHNHGLTDHAALYNILLCTFVSSAIDIDHVFVAKSFKLKDLTNLKQRGIFHCTSFWILLTLPLMLYGYLYKKINIYVLSWMLILAFSSHHIRDANRRGLWLYPFGHTPAINKVLYLFLIMAIPNICALVFMSTKSRVFRNVVINYHIV